jgi:predicted HTH transcriptional regulator
MREDPYITKKLISETTGIAARTMDRAISELIKRGVIERQGSRKTGIWVVH